MEKLEFKPWVKITRENPFNVTITEKLDGTNACIVIQDGVIVGVQSRKRFITPDNDNYGFAGWVKRNQEELLKLGEGYHYGEWVGLGIQKNPHGFAEKRFYLFNTFRWNTENPNLPDCCRVVPILFQGNLLDKPDCIQNLLNKLEHDYSEGAEAEGVVVYYHALRSYTKHTIKSPNGKWCK